MTKSDLEAEVLRLTELLATRDEALRKTKAELLETSKELGHEEKLSSELHDQLDLLRSKRGPDVNTVARAVHDFLYTEAIIADIVPWQAAPSEWRDRLTRVLEPFFDDDVGC